MGALCGAIKCWMLKMTFFRETAIDRRREIYAIKTAASVFGHC